MTGPAAQREEDPTGLLPPRATADGTRRRLLEAALLQFGERGYHGVSVREIAQAAGIRASSVYAHHASKEELLVELMVLGHEEHRDQLRAALLDAGAEPVDQIKAVTHAHVLMHATYPMLARVANREFGPLSPANRDRVMAIREDSVRMFLGVIERGVARGVFHVGDPWLAAAAIGAMGLRVCEWFDVQGGYSAEQVAGEYAELAAKLLR